MLGGSALLLGRAAAWAQTPAALPIAGWQFRDDRGVIIELPEAPGRVAAEVNAASALWDYGVRPVGVFGPQHLGGGEVDARSDGA